MRLLADENFPKPAITALTRMGHDIVWIHEIAPGSDDESVLAHAVRESRILLTLDKDFGELVFRSGLFASGIVVFRLPPLPSRITPTVARLFDSDFDPQGKFVIVEPARVRERPLPRPSSIDG